MNTLLKVFLIAAAGLATVWAESPAFQGYEKLIRVTPLLKTQQTSAGQPIVYPAVAKPEVTAALVEIPPGAETGWHQHPCEIKPTLHCEPFERERLLFAGS